MKLLLHIGTEKTGSSFLQQVCGHNRELLVQRRIWFPTAGEDETRLMKGSISPGNASELSRRIGAADWAGVTEWIRRRIEASGRRGCTMLLLSNELLLSRLADVGCVSRFARSAREAGAGELRMLLIVRDPVDQALSLYKHRAKNGRVGDAADWIEDQYALPRQLASYFSQMGERDIELEVRKYVKDSSQLLRLFFDDWLSVGMKLNVPRQRVNPSLTLSELQILKHIAKRRPDSVSEFYAEFLKLPRARKITNEQLDEYMRELFSRYLVQFSDVWRDLDRRLKVDGGIELPEPSQRISLGHPTEFTFGEDQLAAMAEAHHRSLLPATRMRLILKRGICRPLARMLAPWRRILARYLD